MSAARKISLLFMTLMSIICLIAVFLVIFNDEGVFDLKNTEKKLKDAIAESSE